MKPEEIIESMCQIMPYEFRGRLSIEPYLIEAMELYGKYQYNQALEDAVKNAKVIEAGCYDGGFDSYEYVTDSESILKLKK